MWSPRIIRNIVFVFTAACFLGYMVLLFASYTISAKTRTLGMELRTMKNELVVLESERSALAAKMISDGILAKTELVEPSEKSLAYLYLGQTAPTVALR